MGLEVKGTPGETAFEVGAGTLCEHIRHTKVTSRNPHQWLENLRGQNGFTPAAHCIDWFLDAEFDISTERDSVLPPSSRVPRIGRQLRKGLCGLHYPQSQDLKEQAAALIVRGYLLHALLLEDSSDFCRWTPDVLYARWLPKAYGPLEELPESVQALLPGVLKEPLAAFKACLARCSIVFSEKRIDRIATYWATAGFALRHLQTTNPGESIAVKPDDRTVPAPTGGGAEDAVLTFLKEKALGLISLGFFIVVILVPGLIWLVLVSAGILASWRKPLWLRVLAVLGFLAYCLFWAAFCNPGDPVHAPHLWELNR